MILKILQANIIFLRDVDNNTTIVGDFNSISTPFARSTRLILIKATLALKERWQKLGLISSHNVKCTLFSRVHEKNVVIFMGLNETLTYYFK